MMRNTLLIAIALSLGLSGCTPGTRLLAGPQSPEERVAAGHERFLRYCASCHGREAMGGGPVAGAQGLPDARIATVEHPIGGIGEAALLARAETLVDAVLALLAPQHN